MAATEYVKSTGLSPYGLVGGSTTAPSTASSSSHLHSHADIKNHVAWVDPRAETAGKPLSMVTSVDWAQTDRPHQQKQLIESMQYARCELEIWCWPVLEYDVTEGQSSLTTQVRTYVFMPVGTNSWQLSSTKRSPLVRMKPEYENPAAH